MKIYVHPTHLKFVERSERGDLNPVAEIVVQEANYRERILQGSWIESRAFQR